MHKKIANALMRALDDDGLLPPFGESRSRMRAVLQETLERALAKPEPAGGKGGEDDYSAGVKACIAWVEKRRHDFESEYGMTDPDTGAMEFRSTAREEYDGELVEIEEGLRGLLTPTERTPQRGGVTDAMVDAAMDAMFGSVEYQPGYGGYVGKPAMRDALEAALASPGAAA